MLKTKLIVVALSAAFALPAFADEASGFTPSSNVALVSDYLYRGISQSGTGPAIQGGFDVAHASGLYAGAWGSSISWLSDAGVNGTTSGISNSGLELDTYFGFKGTASAVGYDLGYLRYNYPGTYSANAVKADTDEVYAAVTYSIVTAKFSYSLGDTFGIAKTSGTTYAELNASYPIADTGITLGAHYGAQTFAGTGASDLKTAGTDPTYTDYKLSATKDFSGYVLGLAFSGTSSASGWYTNAQGKKTGQSTTVFSLTRAF
jgi:uncharacterized protein (TIGR02001 family)